MAAAVEAAGIYPDFVFSGGLVDQEEAEGLAVEMVR